MQATITSKGQITLPKALRTALHLSAGDKIEFVLDQNNELRLIPKQVSVSMLKGMLVKPKKAISIDEMNSVIQSVGIDK